MRQMMKLLLKLLKSVATMVSQCLIRVDEWVTRQLVSQPGCWLAEDCECQKEEPVTTPEPEPSENNGQENTEQPAEPQTEELDVPAETDKAPAAELPVPVESEPEPVEPVTPLLAPVPLPENPETSATPEATADTLDHELNCSELTHTGPLAALCLVKPAETELTPDVQPEPVKRKRKTKVPSEVAGDKPKRTRARKVKTKETTDEEPPAKPKRRIGKKQDE